MPPTPEELSQDLQNAFRRAGIDLPQERIEGMLVAYAELRTMLPLLRNARTAAAEPAGTYALDTVTRGAGA